MLKDEFNNFSICKVKPPGGAKVADIRCIGLQKHWHGE